MLQVPLFLCVCFTVVEVDVATHCDGRVPVWVNVTNNENRIIVSFVEDVVSLHF